MKQIENVAQLHNNCSIITLLLLKKQYAYEKKNRLLEFILPFLIM